MTVRVTMMLCDYAVAAEGKLYIQGAGWTFTGPGPSTYAIAALIEVPWDQANRRLPFTLRMLTADGKPVQQPGPTGVLADVGLEGDLEAGRPPGHPQGSPLVVPFAINLPAMQLEPASRYSWVITIDGQTRDEWELSFSTRELIGFPGFIG